MKRILALVLAALGQLCAAQVAVTPIVSPHQTFVDNSGSPCALCKLYTYLAGTTTPQPTYTDSSGTSTNTNPITLDVAGGANIWVASNVSYKFALIDANGGTVWTVDNVKGNGGAIPCATSNAIQYANTSTNTLACDPNIKINPISHAIEVGGSITGPAFTLRNLSTITGSWTMDVTTPRTALNSLGPIPIANLATQTMDSLVMNATGSAATPTAVGLPSGCTSGINYNTTTHAWSCSLISGVPLSSLATQTMDSIVMNATGSTASPTAVGLPSSCTNGVNYNTSTHAWTCVAAPTVSTSFADVTGSRSLGLTYQNTSGHPMFVSGYTSTTGSAWGVTRCAIGPSSPSIIVRADQFGATTASQPAGFSCLVPNNYFYSITVGGTASMSLSVWTETLLQ